MLNTFKERIMDALGLGMSKRKRRIMNCDAAARDFLDKFGKVPGILKVERDGLLSDSILVFFDKKKITKKAHIPSRYKGFDITFYDVRYVLEISKILLNLVAKENVDLSIPEHRTSYEHFTRTIQLCEEMLG